MKPLFVSHEIFRTQAFGAHHPLSTARYPALMDLLGVLGWLDATPVVVARQAEPEILARFHDAQYIAAVERVSRSGMATADDRERYNLGTMECPVFAGLFDRARTTVGGAIRAAELALEGRIVFFPAGGTHHGQRGRASGFCYFNDPVFAVQRLLDAGLSRVGYVDLDAHHGDGVEAVFGSDPRVTLVSLHEEGRWPGTGALNDTCDGRALNVPLPRGITDPEYMALIERVIVPFLNARRPEALVLVLGADGLAGDPLSSMNLMNSTLWAAADAVTSLAPRAVVLGGGGYNPWTTVRLWAGYWGRIAGHSLPSALPTRASQILDSLSCDLVDDEDRDPAWITRLDDPPRMAHIRPVIDALIAELDRRRSL